MAGPETSPNMRNRLLRAGTWLALGLFATAPAVAGYQYENNATTDKQEEVREIRRSMGYIEVNGLVLDIPSAVSPGPEDPRHEQIESLQQEIGKHRTMNGIYLAGGVLASAVAIAGAGHSLIRNPNAAN